MEHADAFTYQHFLIGIFAVANNFAAIGPFLEVCNGLERKDQLRLCKIAGITCLIVMFVALIIGNGLLEFFGISISAFRIAGGILLAISGMKMLSSPAQDEEDAEKTAQSKTYSKAISIAVIPISIPLTTGAGTFSTIVIFADTVGYNLMPLSMLVAAILTTTVAIYLIFRYSTNLLDLLGHTGIDVLIKVVGLFTLALGTQFILTGLQTTFPVLLH